jgi:Patatin-like phospholipase
VAQPFKIGINMAGAISAGAYTAGVLDFLTEALEEWQTAKDAFRAFLARPKPGSIPTPVPLHDTMIDVITGASAGGMCAAIASVMVQQAFEHIQTGDEQNTTNTFYESWVNKIDIHQLLKTDDVAGNKPLLSLLDCSIIDQIAAYALTPKAPQPRPYIASDLTLFLTLTNVRGIPYKLYSDAANTEEFTGSYADRLRFETTVGNAETSTPAAKPLPKGAPGTGAWPLLQEAAKATGAVPVALASRVLERDVADYVIPEWEPLCGDPTALPPAFPKNIGRRWETLNVDGGVTDNSPFELAHDYLATRNPQARGCSNPTAPEEANVAVITVAPFPMENVYEPGYQAKDHQDIWSILKSTFNVVLSESRFLGESLPALMSGISFSRFVVAPSDSTAPGADALQCGALGAFGGFFCRDFRKHDFLLGRRNCQQFLRTRFCLVDTNPIVGDGLDQAGNYAAKVRADYLIGPPNDAPSLPQEKIWMPIIPLCGTAAVEVSEPVRNDISQSDVDVIVGEIAIRLNSIRSKLAPGKLGCIFSKVMGLLLNFPILRGIVRKAVKEAIVNALSPPRQHEPQPIRMSSLGRESSRG